jgi:hypothetical protein
MTTRPLDLINRIRGSILQVTPLVVESVPSKLVKIQTCSSMFVVAVNVKFVSVKEGKL